VITKPFPVVTLRRTRGGFTLKQRGCSRGFTLAELLVSVFVVAIIILMATQLMTSSTAITRTGNKHIDTDTQARAVLDRMTLDLAQMLKRTDVDYYVKGPANYAGHGNGHGWGHHPPPGQLGSDQIAFFSQAPGYNDTSSSFQSPISLVAYRVNQGPSTGNPPYLKLERMGKGLLWNGVSNSVNPANSAIYPIVFLPQTIGAVGSWSAAIKNFESGNASASQDPDYETIGPGVFRFEYYYLLKNGRVTDVPWNTDAGHTSMAGIGLGDVEAIAVAIAVIDPAGRALIDAASPTSLLDLAADMDDFATAPGRGVGGAKKIGDMEYRWKSVLFGDASASPPLPGVVNTGLTSNSTPIPPEAAKSIRIYNRYFDLKSL
jgi:prepilin-type N-terminal cleavage/methylation domain-containing protein